VQEAGKNPPASAERLKLILYFSNAEIMELLGFALGNYFNCEVKSSSSASEAVAALQAGKAHLLVIDGAREDSAVVLEAAKAAGCKVAVHHQKKTAPAIKDLDLAGVFNEPELLGGVSGILKSLGGTARNPAMAEVNPSYPYFRVGIPLLLQTNPLVADIFIRLSEVKYVKLFHKGDTFGPEEVDKYQGKKKLDYLYVRQEDAESITATLNEALERLLKTIPLPQSISTPVSLATIDTVHSLVNQVGFTPEVQRLVKNNIDLVLKEMYASPSLGSILKNLEIDREKYIASHSHMLAEVACALSIAMKWDSETTFKKLTMAALLHDMSLSNQKLARIKDTKELDLRKAEFQSGDFDEYRSHTKRAATLVKGFKEVPADVDKMILQHHELPMGTGFPDALTHVHIHPLASLIMVAHDLVDWVIDHPSDKEPDMMAFIEAHAEKYKIGNFRKLLKALYSLQDA